MGNKSYCNQRSQGSNQHDFGWISRKSQNLWDDKRGEENKEKNLGSKATESDESYIDDDDLALIRRNFKKFCKRGLNSRKKTPPTKEKIVEKPQNRGCFKCGQTYHQIKDCPMWEVEWKKERAEK